jgi:hypothetical protein
MKIYNEVNWEWSNKENKLVETSSSSEEYNGDVELYRESSFNRSREDYPTPYGGNYSTSYLTPHWLMSDITQLLKKDPLSKEAFEEKYFSDEFDPTGKKRRTRYYYDEFPGVEGSFVENDPSIYSDISGYKYHSKDAAYADYLKTAEAYDQGFSTGNPFDRESFVSGIQEARGIEPGAGAPAEAFTELTPQMLKSLRTEHYQPQLEAGRTSLLDQLMKSNRLASAAGGSFAGYGGREKGRRAAGRGYRTGVEDIYSRIDEAKARSLQDIYDVLGQYETIGQP